MYLSALSASSFVDFLKNNLAWIVVGATVIVVAVIILVTFKLKKKPPKYVSDEIDASVDNAAKQKELGKTAEPEPGKTSPAKEEELKPEVAPIQKVHEPAVPKSEEAEGEETEDEFEREAKLREEKLIGPSRNVQKTDNKQKTDNVLKTEEKKQMQKAEDKEKEEVTPENIEENEKETHKRPQSYRILYDKETETWEVRKDNAKRVIRRVKTKKEALEIAKELSQNQDLNLVVHKKDGKFQKKR